MENILLFKTPVVRATKTRLPQHIANAPSCADEAGAPTSAEGNGRKCKSVAGLTDWQKSKIERYIDDHIDTCIRVGELGEQVRLSASRFSKGFKVSFGKSPYDYVLSRRIEAAKYLMVFTHNTLSQIAQTCGLSDQAHLSKIFKRVVGNTPQKWRRGSEHLRLDTMPCPQWTRFLPAVDHALAG